MHPIKKSLSAMMIACVLLSATTACATAGRTNPSPFPSPTWVATTDAQSEYSRALSRWSSQKISDFEITVDVFSSLLPPPCSSKATLVVTGNKLTNVREIETPIPLPLGNGKTIYNPGCHEYERFIPTELFKLVQELLTGRTQARGWNVNFDTEYGYVLDLLYFYNDSQQRIVSSDFKTR